MTVVPLKEILDSAVTGRYGVPAINVVNDLTLESVLAGAVEARSPVIAQASVTTVRSIGSRVFFAMWEAMTANIEVPVALMINGLGGTLISELYLLYGIVHEALSQPGHHGRPRLCRRVLHLPRHGRGIAHPRATDDEIEQLLAAPAEIAIRVF